MCRTGMGDLFISLVLYRGIRMKVEWFCQVMGSEVGPLTQFELIEMVRLQKITPEDLVKRNDSPWVAAFEVKGLFAAAAKAAEASKSGILQKKKASPQDVEQPTPSSVEPIESTEEGSTEDRSVAEPKQSHDPNGSDWFCIASGEKQGPIGFAELQALMADGRLRRTDRVWRSSSPKFRRASEIKGLGAG